MIERQATPEVDDYAAIAAGHWADLVDGTVVEDLAIAMRLERVASRQDQLLRVALRPFAHRGIRTIEDFRFLSLLRRLAPDGISATQASDILKISKAATSTRADRLFDEGIIGRSVEAHDRRSNRLTLQPQSTELVEECFIAVRDARRKLLSDLTATDRSDLHRLLKTLDTY